MSYSQIATRENTNFDPRLTKQGKEAAELALTVMKNQFTAETQCVEKVLRDFLKREPTDEDFTKCTRIYESEEVKREYILAYEATKLGLIRHEFDYNGGRSTFSVIFNPDVIEFRTK